MFREYGKAFRNYFDFKGRSNRREYWLASLLNFLIVFGAVMIFVVLVVAAVVKGDISAYSSLASFGVGAMILLIVLVLYLIAIAIPFSALTARRFRDAGLPALAFWIPFVLNILISFKTGGNESYRSGNLSVYQGISTLINLYFIIVCCLPSKNTETVSDGQTPVRQVTPVNTQYVSADYGMQGQGAQQYGGQQQYGMQGQGAQQYGGQQQYGMQGQGAQQYGGQQQYGMQGQGAQQYGMQGQGAQQYGGQQQYGMQGQGAQQYGGQQQYGMQGQGAQQYGAQQQYGMQGQGAQQYGGQQQYGMQGQGAQQYGNQQQYGSGAGVSEEADVPDDDPFDYKNSPYMNQESSYTDKNPFDQ